MDQTLRNRFQQMFLETKEGLKTSWAPGQRKRPRSWTNHSIWRYCSCSVLSKWEIFYQKWELPFNFSLHFKVNNWVNQCLFKCQLCNEMEESKSRLNLINHVTGRHNMLFTVYEQLYPGEKFIVVREDHRYCSNWEAHSKTMEPKVQLSHSSKSLSPFSGYSKQSYKSIHNIHSISSNELLIVLRHIQFIL